MSLRLRMMLISIAVFATACSHTPSREGSYYRSSAIDDGNRAPASLQPPQNAGNFDDRIDSVTTRTRADYLYAQGEALSFNGEHQKAIENFKAVLIYDNAAAAVHLRLAAEYVKVGQLTESLASAQNAVRLDPKNEDALLLMGGLHSTLKDYDKAISFYEKVLVLNPDNTEAPMYLGAVYAEKKDYPKAVKYFERLAQNEDYQTPHMAYYYLGRIRTDQAGEGKNPNTAILKLAEKSFKQALDKKPDHVDSILALGQLYNKQNKVNEAVTLYKNFQREQGPSEKIAEILSQVYLEQDDYVSALEQFEIIEKRSDDALSVKVRIALMLIELKRYPQAADKLFEVLRQVPDSDKIRFYLAAVFEEMGESEKAIEHFTKVPSNSSFYSESVIHAAYLLKTKRRGGEALELVTTALKAKPDIPQFYSLAATLYDEKGEVASAERVLNEGLTQFPENVQLNFFLGTVFDRKGQKDKVIQQMRKVVNMDPQHVQGLNYLAFTFADQGENLEEAEELAQRAIELEPKDGFILDTYGWILYKRGNWSEAIPFLERAHENQPRESVIAEHLGDAYFKAQLVEKARAMYERAVEFAENKSRAKEIQQKISALEIQYKVRADNRQPASVSDERLPMKPNLEK